MALIRHANAGTMAREAIVLDLGDLVAQGELIKARARAEAQRIIDEAKAERERLLKDAAAEGRKSGLAEGSEKGRAQGLEAGKAEALAAQKARLEQLDKGWQAALTQFQVGRDGMLLEARQDVVRLAAMVAEMVTKRAVALEPGRVGDQLAAVLALVAKPTRLIVAVHPDDEPLVREALPGLAAKMAAGEHVEFVGDASLQRGSCVARSAGGGAIDASIATQLERIVEVLLPSEAGAHNPAPSSTPPEPAP